MDFSVNDPRKLNVDNNEPKQMIKLIGQATTYELDSWNRQGHSDYWWTRADGTEKQVERKTWMEILGNIEKIEEQLSRHLSEKRNAEHILLLEGPILGLHDQIITYKASGRNFSGGRQYKQSLRGVYSWLYQISHYYTIIPTYSLAGSAAALVGMFKSDGKADHATLNRNYHVRTFNRDPVIEKYMAVFDGIGEAKAEILRNRFSTISELVSANRNDFIVLPGFGPALADKLMRQLGTFTSPKIRQEV